MSDHKKHNHVSEKELDNLLNQAFLNLDFNNPKNEEIMETIAQQTMQSKPAYINIFNKSLFTKLIGSILIIGTSLLVYFSFFKNTHKNQTQVKSSSATTPASQQTNPEKLKENNAAVTNITPTKSEIKEVTTQNQESQIENQQLTSTETTNPVKPENYFQEGKKQTFEDTSYVFPKLTEKEIKETKRQKEIMAMMLVKPNKYWYPFIGPKQNKNIYGHANDTSSAFYMARAEVTNLEYRTFLFDLLIHDKKAEFLKAKPHQDLWLDAGSQTNGKKMKDYYFADKKYNDYPVVNITPEGAELYCKWLASFTESEEFRLVIRLPYESEWEKAARSTKNSASAYTWGSDSIQNKRGCHLANFCIKKSSEQLKQYTECKPKNFNAYNSAEYMLGDSMMTAKVSSYNPNDYGLYCIAGNVAEMVYDNKTKTVITKGGSWNSDFVHCKISSREELDGKINANPMTGFRPIFRMVLKWNFGSIERDDPNTGLTTFSESEVKRVEKEKKKMIESLIKFDKSSYSLIPMGTCVYKKDTVSVQSFYMQTTEITNLQYRTFLADLLIQKRNEDYLMAKPKQDMWVKKFPYSYNEPMQNMYFWHPAYDDYPVVNISRKAAEMYCAWLTIEANKVLQAENKPLINDVRIPADIEWAYAANNMYKAKYASGHDFLRDSKGKYEMNFLCFTKDQCRFDSVMKLYIPKQPLTKDEKLLSAMTMDGGFHTVYSRSYQPNAYGLYCMAGNVAEMVNNFDLKTKKIVGKGTKGGSWFSCDYYLEIDADEEYQGETGPSPLIGFRPVITFKKN